MPTNDTIGRTVPTSTESPDLPRALRDYSLSNPGLITVTSRTAANQLRTDYIAACQTRGITPQALHVWRTDTNQEERHNGSGWEYVAGRQHGATVTLSRSGVAAGGSPSSLEVQSFVRSSAGWSISGDSYLVIPQTGLYIMYASFSIDGVASTLGRVFFQFTTSSGAFGARMPATNEDNIGGTAMWPLTAGDRLRMVGFHATGGTRAYTATMQVAMLNSPNW